MIPEASRCHCERVVPLHVTPPAARGQFVLYWMQTTKRVKHNWGLQLAIELANQLQKPLVVYESLMNEYPWASDRLHQFMLEGVEQNRLDCEKIKATYHFYLETPVINTRELFLKLCETACAAVTDDFPCFFLPKQNEALAKKIEIPFFAVDSNGVVPLRCFQKQEYAARTLRPKMHKLLPGHLKDWKLSPLKFAQPALQLTGAAMGIKNFEWTDFKNNKLADLIAKCPIDHEVKAHPRFKGGRKSGLLRLKNFLKTGKGYVEDRNDAGLQATSELSPYLHFGYLSALEIALAVYENRDFTREDRAAFLEELIVRRELAFNYTLFNPHYDKISGLPNWVQQTLDRHRGDHREHVYNLQQFEKAQTADELWNAAQLELVISGKMHNYIRMLWGKKILEWSKTPEDALKVMIQLNNKYALDGRDPNSYVGFQWCLGLHDRPWGPEREIFGLVRYMSSDSTKKKLDWKGYVRFVRELQTPELPLSL